MNTQKKYIISENTEDFIGYKGQPVTIVKSHIDNYVDVTDGEKVWTCGEEELTEVADSAPFEPCDPEASKQY